MSRCTEKSQRVVSVYLFLAAAFVMTRCLIPRSRCTVISAGACPVRPASALTGAYRGDWPQLRRDATAPRHIAQTARFNPCPCLPRSTLVPITRICGIPQTVDSGVPQTSVFGTSICAATMLAFPLELGPPIRSEMLSRLLAAVRSSLMFSPDPRWRALVWESACLHVARR